LKKYLKLIKKGKVKVTYKQKDKRGRYCANGSLSLQNIARPIRHTIAQEYYYDVDIKNAHPVFLAHYCDTKGLQHAHLASYIAKRDNYFALLQKERGMDREKAKKFMLSIVSTGKCWGKTATTPTRL
jgi:hypothetical protein